MIFLMLHITPILNVSFAVADKVIELLYFGLSSPAGEPVANEFWNNERETGKDISADKL